MSSPVDVTPISSRESAETKGRRYLVEGRLSIKCVTDRLILATCRGDQGDVYNLGYSFQAERVALRLPCAGALRTPCRSRPRCEEARVSERLLTARELGDLLGMSAGWVLDKWEAGELPGFKLGDGPAAPVRFRLSEVEAWLEERRRGPEVARRLEPVT